MEHEHVWSPWYQVAPLHEPVEWWQKECMADNCNSTTWTNRHINESRSMQEIAELVGV